MYKAKKKKEDWNAMQETVRYLVKNTGSEVTETLSPEYIHIH